MGIRTRFVAAAVAAATLAAMAGTATGSAAPASPTAPAPSSENKEGDKDAVVAKVAASLQVTVRQLVTALDHLKQAVVSGTSKAEAVAAFATELKVSLARAEQALQDLSTEDKRKPKPKPGKDKDKDKDKDNGVPEEAVKLLAAELHISAESARQVFKDLEKVKSRGDDIVKDPAFIAIAKGLGSTPQQLLATLVKVKQASAGAPKEKVPGGSPTK